MLSLIKNLGGKYPLNASFFVKNWKEEMGRKATNRIIIKNKMVFGETLFEFA
jgi:hypothetical protein